MTTKVLVDTNFVVTLYNQDEANHQKAVDFAKKSTDYFIMPDVVLVEALFLVKREGGTPAAKLFFEVLSKSVITFEPVYKTDLARIGEVMTAYPRANLDFVDCAIVTIAERLNITRICTFDRRDFSIIIPQHTPYFELLP